MNKRKFVDFEAVKAAVNITQVLEHYNLASQFTKSNNGDTWSGPCPIHKGTNPTQFRVSVSKNCWHCFSGDCRAHGNVLEFVARMENINITHAALKLAEWFQVDVEWKPDTGRPSKRALPDEAASSTSEPSRPSAVSSAAKPSVKGQNLTNTYESGSNKKLNFALQNLDASHPYLIERGLSPETIAEFGLGFCAKGSMKDRIVIPIHNPAGEIVAYAGRWPGEPPEGQPKYKLPTGFKKSAELFNLHRAIRESAEQPLVIVEGFFDAITLYQHGVRKVVALMGSTASDAQAELILNHTHRSSRIIVMLDEDDAGKAGRDDVASCLAKLCFIRVHQFAQPNMQPEHLSADELTEILEGQP